MSKFARLWIEIFELNQLKDALIEKVPLSIQITLAFETSCRISYCYARKHGNGPTDKHLKTIVVSITL